MKALRKATVVLGAFCLVAMTLITCADVTMRYFFTRPIFGSGEMVQLLLAIVVFAGMFAVTSDRGHVNVSLFEPLMMRVFRRGYRSIFDTMSLVGVVSVTAILAWRTWDYARYPEETVVLKIPLVLVVSALALLSAISVLGAVAAMQKDKRPTPPHSPQAIAKEDAK
ncbi:MAG: TRAP transporter small permease [Maritimibacter sp.]|nr:TRAP transporter small permease [Maritimibacter sp.]